MKFSTFDDLINLKIFIICVLHSGAAQALIAFSKDPKLQSNVNQFIALSPGTCIHFISILSLNSWRLSVSPTGAYVRNLESRPLRMLARLSNRYPVVFWIMFGRQALLPFMEVMRKYLGIRVFGYMAFCM